MQSRFTEQNTPNKRDIIAFHNLPKKKDEQNIKGDTTVFTHQFLQTWNNLISILLYQIKASNKICQEKNK